MIASRLLKICSNAGHTTTFFCFIDKQAVFFLFSLTDGLVTNPYGLADMTLAWPGKCKSSDLL